MTEESVLDVACGFGSWTERLRKMTTGRVYGVDISEDMI